MDSSFTDRWISKFRILTLSLIFSGALNIGLIAAFVALLVQDREKSLSVSQPRTAEKMDEATNLSLLASFSHLSFRELSSLLTNTDAVEDGFRKRDLAVSALVAFHDFNIEKAIGAMPAQRRTFKIDDSRTLEMYPNLSDDQFQAIIHYAYLEKWPLTSHGLFAALQKSPKPHDPDLVQAFTVTKEFYALQTLFQKTEVSIPPEKLVDLASEGNWQILDGFLREQTQMMDLSDDRRRRLLLSYLALQSPVAADLLLQTDYQFALKRLDDKGLLDLLDHVPASEPLQKFCIDLLQSARSDAIHEKSARWLYRIANEEMPQPFDRMKALLRFAPSAVLQPAAKPAQSAPRPESAPRDAKGKTHTVKEGESLWKIARQYHVKIDDLMSANKLDKDRLKPGMVLKIPAQGTGSTPPR
jgi:hypothetical protein